MSYTINNTRGTVVTTVTPGTTQVVGGITLIGKNYTGYGELIAEDFVKLLENQANSSAPSSPQTGQLWYDTGESVLKAYDGTAWDRLNVTVGTSAPSSATAGTLWMDTTSDKILKIYDGAAWQATAMATANARQTSVTLKVGPNAWATAARRAGYTAGTNVSGDTDVEVTAIIGKTGAGADQVIALYAPASFDISTGQTAAMTNGTLQYDIRNNFSVTTSGAAATGSLQAGLNIRDGYLDPAAVAPLADEALAVQDASNAAVSYDSAKIMILTKTTTQAHAGKLEPTANASVDLGSNTKRYATIYGVATSAQYADIAERFAADVTMDPGTIVALGGVEEITKTADRADENVFGVISETPAFRMNDGAGDDTTHPFVAFSGRVSCKVKGPVAKGDRLVSSDIPGVAVKADPNDNWKATFGRALVSKTTEEVDKITIAIGVK
tara:strand:- start:401 stop:1720 length:1320 start_codon:yes stop_codon:yes gene_type:complete